MLRRGQHSLRCRTVGGGFWTPRPGKQLRPTGTADVREKKFPKVLGHKKTTKSVVKVVFKIVSGYGMSLESGKLLIL